jgi:Protein of unknown function (DUF4242)
MACSYAISRRENDIRTYDCINAMPTFLDVHKVPFSEDNLRELCQSPADEFGVSHVNLFYNKESSVCFCLLNAPNLEAVERHHKKANIECEWITEVTNIVNEGLKLSLADKR